jgi:NAD(P)-dependent dehydrogenase (short-subunit alcohol dehydrogenase family)
MQHIALITGIETGIGRAAAVAFAQAGYDVGGTWLGSAETAQEVAAIVEECGRRSALRQLDLSSPTDGAVAIDELADELAGVDVLVNNAAIGYTALFVDTPLADWLHVLNVNLAGPFCCAQAAVRRMLAVNRPGTVINVTSVQESYPVIGSAAYGAAKGGLRLLTRVMAAELGTSGIRVNAVAPGEINTAMNHREGVPGTAVRRPDLPLGRAGSASEVAAAIVWLASEAASYLTGATLVVDGGAELMGPQLATGQHIALPEPS